MQSLGLQGGLLASPKPMRFVHGHSEIELNYVEQGGVTYLYRGKPRRIASGQMAIFFGMVPHTMIAADPETRFFWITVPMAWVIAWNIPPNALRALLAGDWWLSSGQKAARFAVEEWVETLNGKREKVPRWVMLELEACFLWCACKHRSRKHAAVGQTHDRNGTKQTEKMAAWMADHYLENPDVARIADSSGLHPNYAMSVFRATTGMTIRSYLAQLRVSHAQRLLLTTDQKIVDVAFESGFETVSSFYEAFVRMVGITPSRYRKNMRFAKSG